MNVLNHTDIELLTAFRHDLHQHPELSGQEFRTTEKIKEFLAALPGCEILHLPVNTGVVARIPGNQVDGISESITDGDSERMAGCMSEHISNDEIMLRADIDALPQTECGDNPWKSCIPGVMHACGHDLHTTALCGAALLLSRMKQKGCLHTTVDLVFQPAEEMGVGARMLIEAGLFDQIHPSVCYGMHNWPSVEIGKVVCREGALMAALRNCDILVHGSGGHGSMPHLNVDPIVCTAAIIQSLQTVVSRNVDPLEAGILSINRIEGGSQANVVVDQVRLSATVRSLSEDVLDRMIERMTTIIEHTAKAYECRAEIIWKNQIPAVWNSSELTEKAAKCVSKTRNILTQAPPTLVGEDFSLYRNYVPSFFFFIGSKKPEADIHELHTPEFYVDDSAIPYAAELYAACGTTS